MAQVVQLIGSLGILTAFALAQFGVFDVNARSYLVLNVLGAGILSASAWHEEQWGFLLLEGVWTLVSLFALGRTYLRPSPS